MAVVYPATLDTVVGTGTSGATLSVGGPGGESHVSCHADMSSVLVSLETNAVANDTYLQQFHCDVGPATLVTATAYSTAYVTLAASGTATNVIGTASHPGQWALATSATDSGRSEISGSGSVLTTATYQTGFYTGLAFRCVVLTPAALPTTTTCVFKAGFCDALGVFGQAVNGIEWVYYPSASAFWTLNLTKASTTTVNASAITPTTATWYDLQILVTASGVSGRAAVFSPTALPTALAGGPFTTNQPLTTTSMFWHVLAMNNTNSATSFIYTVDLVEVAGSPATGPASVCSNYRGASLVKGF